MPIKYYYDSKYKKPWNPIEKLQQKSIIRSVSNKADLTAAGTSYTLWHPAENWDVHEVLMHFSGATARSYSVNKVIGRGIITNYNDILWFMCDGYPAQAITLSQGFYSTGTELATHLKAILDANTAFITMGLAPFTVSYSTATGLFTIDSTAGNIKFLNTNTSVGVNRNSTAGATIGFTVDSSFTKPIVSDTVVAGLGTLLPIDTEAASTDLNTVVNVDSLSPHFDVDSGLNLTIGTVALAVDYKITYEEII